MSTLESAADSNEREKKAAVIHQPLLLSSLADLWSLLEPLLTVAKPKSICEIGLGNGRFAKLLTEFCAKTKASYTGIDFSVDAAALEWLPPPEAVFIKQKSLEVLPTLPAHDVYFVDGDHNYHTVLNELRLITDNGRHGPLIFLHDTGWPWGRRDQYCSPEAIPPEFRHPHSNTLGVRPGENELGAGGFCGTASDYRYAAATHEGGGRNGVLTAVEDFMQAEGELPWQLIQINAVFGLGILFAPSHISPLLKQHLDELSAATKGLQKLLGLLERNRVNLFLKYLEQIEQFQTLHRQYGKLEDHSRKFEASYDELKKSYHNLSIHERSLMEEYEKLALYCKDLEKNVEALASKINAIPVSPSSDSSTVNGSDQGACSPG